MNMLVLDLKAFSLDKLQVKKPFCLSENKHLFELKYDNNDIIIQSPPSILPYKPSIYDDGYGSIVATYNEAAVDFIDTLKEIETAVLTRIRNKTKYALLLESREHHSPISDKRIRYVNTDISQVRVYDLNGKAIQAGIAGLRKDTKITLISHISGLNIRGDRYGLLIKVIQIQVLDVTEVNITIPANILTNTEQDDALSVYKRMFKMGIPKEAIEHKMRMDGVTLDINQVIERQHNITSSQQQDPSVSARCIEEMSVYERMLKMGIPRQAVEHKMKMDGVDIAKLTIQSRPGPAPPPPRPPPAPPPPPHPTISSHDSDKAAAMFADIKNGNFKLRKVGEIKTPDTIKLEPKKPIINTAMLGPQKPPSLSEILAARKNLRAIK
jgi:hypothetical protein